MQIRKAVITAAGKNQRTLPLQTLVDRDGVTKTALAILVEEVLQAGIEQVGVVISPGDEPAYRAAAAAHGGRLTFIEQAHPFGAYHAQLLPGRPVSAARRRPPFAEHEG
jgi:UTP--glucose-1-phosphate uridylyltransferase